MDVVSEQAAEISHRHDSYSRIMPTGFMMALTFGCGNSAYLYLTVAFVQVGFRLV